MHSKQKIVAGIYLVSSMAIIAFVILQGKNTLNNISFDTFLWLQMLAASVSMLFFCFLREKRIYPTGASIQEWLIVIGIGVLNFLIVRACFIYALEILDATTHAFMMSFVAIVTFCFSVLLLGEKGGRSQIIGVLLSSLGLWIYFSDANLNVDPFALFILLIAVVSLALTNILLRKRHLLSQPKFSTNQLSTISIIVGTMPIILYGFLFDYPLPEIQTFDVYVILANGIIAVAFGMIVFTYVMKYLLAHEASVLATSSVIFIALWSVPLLDIYPDFFQIIGISLMIAGIIFVQSPNKIIDNKNS